MTLETEPSAPARWCIKYRWQIAAPYLDLGVDGAPAAVVRSEVRIILFYPKVAEGVVCQVDVLRDAATSEARLNRSR